MRAIEDDQYNPTLTKRLGELEAEKAVVDGKLAAIAPAPKIELHPNMPALYRAQVERLEEALGAPETRVEASAVIASLISRIVLTPTGDDLEVRLYGDLAQMLALGAPLTGMQKPPRLSTQGHYCRWLRGSAATFTERDPD
jgi:hypothetical protein